MKTLIAAKSKSPLLRGGTEGDGVDKRPSWQKNSPFAYWNLPKNQTLLPRAKYLRNNSTLSEILFWKTLNNKSLLGFDLDRQVVIGNYIVDFFVPELGLLVEIDGSTHDEKVEYDKHRDKYLQSLDLLVIHYTDLSIKKSLSFVVDNFVVRVEKRRGELSSDPPRPPSVSTPQEGSLDNLNNQT